MAQYYRAATAAVLLGALLLSAAAVSGQTKADTRHGEDARAPLDAQRPDASGAREGAASEELDRLAEKLKAVAAPAAKPDTPTAEQTDAALLKALEQLHQAPAPGPRQPTEEQTAHSQELDRKLRAVAEPSLDLQRDYLFLNAAQQEDAGRWDAVPGDTPPGGIPVDTEVPDVPYVPYVSPAEPDTPPAEAPVDEADLEVEEAPDVEDLEFEPPAPRVGPLPGATEAQAEIVRRMSELMDQAEATPVTPISGDPAVVTAEGTPAVLRAPHTNGDPLAQIVNLDFREMDLVNVVAILAHRGNINIVSSVDLVGTVTANLRGVPLRQGIETVLRTNGLGLIEEQGIYHIVPYQEALEAQRETILVELENAKASDVQRVLQDVLRNTMDMRIINIAANDPANMVVISGPRARLDRLVRIARDLDVAEPVLPTVTEPIRLNYAAPADIATIIGDMLTPDVGSVAADERGRHIIVQDLPVVVEQIRMLITELDRPIKQVIIDTMVVDVTLQDAADTGVNWLLNAVQSQSRRSAATGGPMTGVLQELGLGTDMRYTENPGSALAFHLLTGSIDWGGVIQAEVRSQNGRLVSNPVLVAMENTMAKISISQEIPYIELRQTAAGGSQTTTEFKEVGTVLQVTPSVTHDDHIIVQIQGKESAAPTTFQGIPVEDKREIETNLRIANGQTIFIGGLRKNDDGHTIRKVPILGDVPVVNFLFRSNQRREQINELLVFMTCTVMEDDPRPLTAYQRSTYEAGRDSKLDVNAQQTVVRDTLYPGENREPVWRWRR